MVRAQIYPIFQFNTAMPMDTHCIQLGRTITEACIAPALLLEWWIGLGPKCLHHHRSLDMA